jgi:hypothetical protein
MTKMQTPNYRIGTGDGMEGRRVAVILDRSVALGGRKGYIINGDYRCGALTWVPGLSGEHTSAGGLNETAKCCAPLGGA